MEIILLNINKRAILINKLEFQSYGTGLALVYVICITTVHSSTSGLNQHFDFGNWSQSFFSSCWSICAGVLELSLGFLWDHTPLWFCVENCISKFTKIYPARAIKGIQAHICKALLQNALKIEDWFLWHTISHHNFLVTYTPKTF